MNDKLSKLILLIVSEIKARESYVTKTKLLKLLYLFDVEYYRIHKEIFTEFKWKFYHLGPWTAQYDSVLDTLISNLSLKAKRSENFAYDTAFLDTYENIEFGDLFNSYKDSLILKDILQTWGERSTNEILDYVYFETEPMIFGKRNELLDFSTIPQEVLVKYKRSVSGKSPKQIQTARQKFDSILKANKQKLQKKRETIGNFYDADFYEAMDILRKGDS